MTFASSIYSLKAVSAPRPFSYRPIASGGCFSSDSRTTTEQPRLFCSRGCCPLEVRALHQTLLALMTYLVDLCAVGIVD